MTASAASSGYLIDTILPTSEVHLLGGPSGAGKTRWLLRFLTSWIEGGNFFGYTCHPVPWLYVAADRSMASVARTLGGMGIDHKKIPTIPAWDEGMEWIEIANKIEKRKEELIVIESFGSFVKPPANGNLVKGHLLSVSRLLQGTGKTVIGVVESPKMKPYERYENPRQRISGVAAWSHFSETIFLVEPDNENPTSTSRSLHICPRNAPMQQFSMMFNNSGDLVLAGLLDQIVTTPKNGHSKRRNTFPN